MVYESDFYTTRRPYSRPSPTISSYSVTNEPTAAKDVPRPWASRLPPLSSSALPEDSSDSESEAVNLADLADPYGPYGRFAKYIKPDERKAGSTAFASASAAPRTTRSEATTATRTTAPRRAAPVEDSDTSDSDVPIAPRRPPLVLELDESSADEDGFYETKYSKLLRECRPAVRQGPRRPRADTSDDDDDDLLGLSARSSTFGRRHSDGLGLRRREEDGLTPTLSGLDLGGLDNGLHRHDGHAPRSTRARAAKPMLSDSEDEAVHPDLEKYRPARTPSTRSRVQEDAKGSALSRASRRRPSDADDARDTETASTASSARRLPSAREDDVDLGVSTVAYAGRRRQSAATSLDDKAAPESTVSSTRRPSASRRRVAQDDSASSLTSARPGCSLLGSSTQSWVSSSDATLSARAEGVSTEAPSSRSSRSWAWPSDSASGEGRPIRAPVSAQGEQSSSSRAHRPPGEAPDDEAPKYSYRTRRPRPLQDGADLAPGRGPGSGSAAEQGRSRPSTAPEVGRGRPGGAAAAAAPKAPAVPQAHSAKLATADAEAENFDDETRSIRAQTAALLKRVHSPIPRSRGPLHAVLPTPSSLMETPVPHRHTSDYYIEGLLGSVNKVHRDVASRSFYVEHPRPYIGKGNLACVSFAGGKAYNKRRGHYDVPEDHHNVQDDIATLSYYNRARAVANGQEPGPEPAAATTRKSRPYKSTTDSDGLDALDDGESTIVSEDGEEP